MEHITLVDSARVSFSNPVRQSLYTFKNCVGGSKEKAACAAEALRAVHPCAVSFTHLNYIVLHPKGWILHIVGPGIKLSKSTETTFEIIAKICRNSYRGKFLT